MSNNTILATNAQCISKKLNELNLKERCIREYILQLNSQQDDCVINAIYFKDGDELLVAPCSFEGDDYQAELSPRTFDVDDIIEGPVGLYALNEYASSVCESGLFAIDLDRDDALLFYPKA